MKKKIIIKNPSGIHIEHMLYIVKLSRQYESNVKIIKDNIARNAKEFFDLVEGELIAGSVIYLDVNGSDENMAFNELYNFIINLKD